MSTKTTNLNLRIDPILKGQAEMLFDELGLSISAACNIFIKQAVRQGKIPFEITTNVPNKITIAAMKESEIIARNPKVKGYKTTTEMFDNLAL